MFSTEFLLTSLIIVLIPGTGVIYTVSTGLFHGRRASVAAAVGCTAGILPHLLVSLLGLSYLLHLSAVVFQGLKFVGVAYLLYLAWALWRDTGGISFASASPHNTLWRTAGKAVLLNLLNPKLTLFFFAFLPLFITPNTSSPVAELLLLSVVFMALTLIIFSLYGLLASGVRRYVVSSPSVVLWLRRSFAVAFAGLGLKLALTSR